MVYISCEIFNIMVMFNLFNSSNIFIVFRILQFLLKKMIPFVIYVLIRGPKEKLRYISAKHSVSLWFMCIIIQRNRTFLCEIVDICFNATYLVMDLSSESLTIKKLSFEHLCGKKEFKFIHPSSKLKVTFIISFSFASVS